MYNAFKPVTFIIICLFICAKINAHKLNFRIKFSASLQANKAMIFLDNGIEETMLSPQFKNNETILIDDIKGDYATLTIVYPVKNGQFSGVRLIVNAQLPAYVIFKQIKDSTANQLTNFILHNAIDGNNCKQALKLKKYCKLENDSNLYYSRKYNELASDLNLNAYNMSSMKLALKQLDFIRLNGNEYYYFWYFRIYIASTLKKTHKLLIYEAFNKIFPLKFQESVEGKSLKEKLEGNLFIKKGQPSPVFSAADYLGNIISLKELKGKYILLDFWATWCAPCIEKIPEIKKIRETYPANKLEIISVSYDKDSAAFIKGISSLNMNWTHLYSNNNLRNLFGDTPIPALYLIDDKGIIQFSSWGDSLDKLQEILKDKIKN